MSELNKNILMWVVIALVLIGVFSKFQEPTATSNNLPYSQFLDRVKTKDIRSVEIRGQSIIGYTNSSETFTTYAPLNDPKMYENNAVLLHILRDFVLWMLLVCEF